LLLDRIQVVLVRTGEAMNLGAAARAMKNCELSRLTLVAPQTCDLVTARRVAVHAEDLLDEPRVVGSVSEAVEDCVWVVGTTSRPARGRLRLSPSEVAAQASLKTRDGPVALVFGGEESGLSNEDLVRCHAVSCIPSGSLQPSFNLAQAVMIYAYELYLEARGRRARASPSESPSTPAGPGAALATERDTAHVEQALRELLLVSGFADPDRPRHGVLELLQTLKRAGLTAEEARLWHAALKASTRAAQRGGRAAPS
jgi:tRNA/rRNA methyltransferase